MAGFTTISHGLDWQAASFVNEFIEAFNERVANRDGDTGHLLTAVSSGSDIQLASFWRGIQNALISQWNSGSGYKYGDLVGSHRWMYFSDGLPSSYDYQDEPAFMSFLDFCEACDEMPDLGFRRATSWDPAVDDWTDLNDNMFSYGTMQSPDIIGPWIFEDLQTVFKNMKLLYQRNANIWFEGMRKTAGDFDYDQVEALFTSATPASTRTLDCTSAFAGGTYTLTRSEGEFSIWDEDRETPIPAEEIARCGKGKVKMYVMGYNPGPEPAEFDDNGDGLQEEVYTQIIEFDLGSISDTVGSLSTIPNRKPKDVTGSLGYRTSAPVTNAPRYGLWIDLDDGLKYK
jgi:hypothetical protein